MVSITGVQQAQPLVAQIQALEAAIANLQAVLGANDATIWKMEADAYVGPQKISQTLSLQYDMNTADTANILNAVLTGLQSELTALNAQLAAIS